VPNTAGNFTLSRLGNSNITNVSEFGLIKFDMSSLARKAGIIISDAKLRLYLTSNNSAIKTLDLYAHRSLRAWVYNQVTRDEYKSGSSWQTVGGVGNLDREAAPIGLLSLATGAATSTWYEMTLTPAAIQAMIRGTFTDNGLFLWADIGDSTYYSSRTFDFTGTERAQLQITYTYTQENNNLVWWE